MSETSVVRHMPAAEWPESGFLATCLLSGTVLLEDGPVESILAGGIPGQPEPDLPEKPGEPPLPSEPGEPTMPDQPPPAPVAAT